MRRSIFKAGAVTAFGLLIAFAIVSANSNTRHAATAAKATSEVVATPASNDECTSSDVCCTKKTEISNASIAAAPRARKDSKKVAAATTVPAYSSGAVIAIDPETGELGMPSPQQMGELLGMPSVIPGEMNDSDVGLFDVQLPRGGAVRDLQGRFQETSTVTIAPSGKMIFGCGMHDHGTSPSPTQAAPSALEEK